MIRLKVKRWLAAARVCHSDGEILTCQEQQWREGVEAEDWIK
jgi:hypothetical protein